MVGAVDKKVQRKRVLLGSFRATSLPFLRYREVGNILSPFFSRVAQAFGSKL